MSPRSKKKAARHDAQLCTECSERQSALCDEPLHEDVFALLKHIAGRSSISAVFQRSSYLNSELSHCASVLMDSVLIDRSGAIACQDKANAGRCHDACIAMLGSSEDAGEAVVYNGFAIGKEPHPAWRYHSWIMLPKRKRLIEMTPTLHKVYVGAPIDTQAKVKAVYGDGAAKFLAKVVKQ